MNTNYRSCRLLNVEEINSYENDYIHEYRM